MYSLVRRALFRLPPERAHHVVMALLAAAGSTALLTRLLGAAYRLEDPRLAVQAFGLKFPSPVGLAAGLDKDGMAVPALAAIGFGHLELGSVTARPQPGNPRPRLFRLPEDEALINRMGFNNLGSSALARRLARLRRAGSVRVPLGINVGKSRDVPVEAAVEDYERALRDVWNVADYLAVNVSSPNTPGLRSLQARGPLDTLLALVARLDQELGHKPVLLKLSPDLADEPLLEAVRIAERRGLAGIVATNTTTRREGLRSPHSREVGGLSGRPLANRSLQVLKLLRAHTALPIVSVGGIASGADVVARLAAGASLVQVYTAFIYRGPALLRELNRAVLNAVQGAGLSGVPELTARGLPAPRSRPAPPSVR